MRISFAIFAGCALIAAVVLVTNRWDYREGVRLDRLTGAVSRCRSVGETGVSCAPSPEEEKTARFRARARADGYGDAEIDQYLADRNQKAAAAAAAAAAEASRAAGADSEALARKAQH